MENVPLRTGPNSATMRRDENVVIRALEPLARYAVYWVEFLGTFFLVLTVGFVSAPTNNIAALGFGPLAVGSMLMVCVFMGGHISGAHYNPAVTFGVWLTGRGKITTAMSFGYLGAQLFGSFIAGCVYWTITGYTFALEPQHGATMGHAFSSEALYAFLLVSVVLNTATSKSHQDNSFYGLAIGFTVVSGGIAVGPISGGGFNPAVGFGPIVVDAFNHGADRLRYIWIYWLGPLFGSILAAIAFRITNHHKEYRLVDVSAVVEHEPTDAEARASMAARAASGAGRGGSTSHADAPTPVNRGTADEPLIVKNST
jgi:aquaporin Z